MISISAPVFDINGSLLIDRYDVSGVSGLIRRVSRSATLDGQASISDFGYTDADRTLAVEWQASESEHLLASRLLKTYSRVIVSIDSGCFLCAPSEIVANNGLTILILLIERKLSE